MKLIFIFIFSIFIHNNVFATASDNLVVNTSSGDVHGNKYKNIFIFEDIPYAKPPVGNLRWKAPRELDSPAIINPKENNFCIQRPSNLGGAEGEGRIVGSEDCLYLDVFVPKKRPLKGLPVMFWIHGGGNTSGLKDLYDFSKLVARKDVIVVRLNYRLGPFGWFTHPAIQDFQEGDDKTSNFGTLDIIMALKWVKKNISKFGGDENNVTIFGESAGGHNVLSLLVSKKAKGLFHKAISMSGYTTSISTKDAYLPQNESSTSNFSSSKVVEKLYKNYSHKSQNQIYDLKNIRKILLSLDAYDFFEPYAERDSYEEIPLLTADGVVIPKVGLDTALSIKEYVNIVPTIAGSNRDEVKLWLATARYFVDLEYSLIGSMLSIPKIKLSNESTFEAFNYYRSSAWQIRGVSNPLKSLHKAGNNDLYAYRYDWDDHRRLVVADFKKLIGAAHASEIPMLIGDYDLVGGYPLSDLLYPPSFSKRYTSKNMMTFWTNFAKFGSPGKSTNSVLWEPYIYPEREQSILIIDKKKNLRMKSDNVSFEFLKTKLKNDIRVNDLEKCVLLLQMFTYVGNDLYEKQIGNYPNQCSRKDSENFIKDNASYIEY